MRLFHIIILAHIMFAVGTDMLAQSQAIHEEYQYVNAALKRYGDLETMLSDNSNDALQNRMRKLKNIPSEYIKHFARLQIQDFDGRLKPLDTFATEIMRKITHTTNLNGLTPNQFLIALMVFPFDMMRMRIIYVDNKELLKLLGMQAEDGKLVALKDVMDMQQLQAGKSFESAYKIYNFVQDAMRKAPAKQNAFDKEILKLHEKISYVQAKNIWNYLRIFPYHGRAEWFSPNSTAITDVIIAYNDWYLGKHVGQFPKQMDTKRDNADSIKTLDEILDKSEVTPSYAISINTLASFLEKELLVGILKDDFSNLDGVLQSIHNIQQKEAGGILLSDALVQTEIFFNYFDMFSLLQYMYLIIGLLSLCVVLYALIMAKILPHSYKKIFFILLCILFIWHTLALLVRWYIAGHAPWSNAYESMIYIAWASVFAAILLRKSFLMLCAASFLAGITLMVAHLGAMDPQISNLVPVLQSYWLNIHVSIIVASYGFFGLCMVLGILCMLLYILRNDKKPHIDRAILALTILNERSMIIGVIALTIGTFLGGIWANESWGRYWGWDAKETWSLATIAIYACILHLRMFVKEYLPYVFNVASVLGFYSVLMTYFGVNYYLAGMHSYAKGDGANIQLVALLPHIALFCVIVGAWFKRKLQMIAI